MSGEPKLSDLVEVVVDPDMPPGQWELRWAGTRRPGWERRRSALNPPDLVPRPLGCPSWPVTRYWCPLRGCRWTYDQEWRNPASQPVPCPEASLDEIIGAMASATLTELATEAEAVVKAHLETHPLLEWVNALQQAQAALPALERVAQAARKWDALVEASAAMSYVMDPAELEQRERAAESHLRDAIAALRGTGYTG